MHKLLLVIFALLFSCVHAQTHYHFTPLVTAKYQGSAMAIDDMGNLLITEGAKLTKLDAQGHFLGRFFPPFQAKINAIDVDNPRRIMLWYQKYNYIVFLDQNLAMQNNTDPTKSVYTDSPLDMEKLGRYDLVTTCLDTYAGFWVYGEDMQDICLYDNDNALSFCADSPEEVAGLKPNKILMHEDHLFINFPDKGVLVYDADANFIKLLPIEGLNNFYVYHNILYYVNNNSLISINIETEETTYNILPLGQFKAWAMQLETAPKRIAFLTSKGVEVFGIEDY